MPQDSKISQLPNAGALTGGEAVPMVQVQSTVQATTGTISGYVINQIANATVTFNNKLLVNCFVAPRVKTTLYEANMILEVNYYDVFNYTYLDNSFTVDNPTAYSWGQPYEGQRITLKFADDGNQQNITWGNRLKATQHISLPNKTVAGKTMWLDFIYDSSSTAWYLVNYQHMA